MANLFPGSRGLLLLIATAIAANPAFAETGGSNVRSVVDQAAARFFRGNPQAVGVSIGVYQNGNSYFYRFGSAVPGGHAKPSQDAMYAIASITKTFTGILIAQAALDGRLKLDDDVRKFLPGEYPNLAFNGKPIRVYDLLDHQSGLPFFLPDNSQTQPDSDLDTVPWTERIAQVEKTYTREDFFRDLHNVKLVAIPGTKFQYSNAGAMLAGYILEKLYGESYESLLKKEIFDPLHMRSTRISVPPSLRAKVVTGFDEKGRPMPNIPDELQGAGAIRTTTADLLRYAVWNLAENVKVVRLAHTPVLTSGTYSAGLNWQEVRDHGRRIIWQEGNIDGFNALCILEPELRISLVVLANEEDRASAHGQSVLANEVLKGLDANSIVMP